MAKAKKDAEVAEVEESTGANLEVICDYLEEVQDNVRRGRGINTPHRDGAMSELAVLQEQLGRCEPEPEPAEAEDTDQPPEAA